MIEMPMKCVHCRNKAVSPIVLPIYTTELEHDGRKYEIKLNDFSVLQCADCGSLVYDDEASDRLFERLRSAAGLLPASVIREQRIKLGLTQREMAARLRISESTLCRWETGAQLQQRVMDLLLRAFFALPEFREFSNDPENYKPSRPVIEVHAEYSETIATAPVNSVKVCWEGMDTNPPIPTISMPWDAKTEVAA